MTLEEYLALVPNFNSTRPRYMNTLAALLRPLVDAQAMLAKLREDFDLDTAIGVQLDMVGQWIGRDRYLDLPISDVYFSFDTPDLGFDQGVWQGLYDPTSEVRRLDDETYRTVLKLQAIANHWDGTLPSIAEAFNTVFPGVVIDDRGDKPGDLMTMEVLIPAVHLSALLEAVLIQDFMLKPSGVRLNVIKTSVSTEPLFGFDVSNNIIAGFDEAAWGKIIYAE